MHPAPSLILFTTLAGAGYGLLAIWSLAGLAGAIPPDGPSGALGLGMALLLATAGLVASTFHLGHPERAWRAFSQWRTSWLSREGVAGLATLLPALILLAAWAFGGRIAPVAAVLAALGAVLTLVCTGQIYATLRPIARWHQPLTTPVFCAMAAASGAVLAVALARLRGLPAGTLEVTALVILPVAWGLKVLWWRNGDAAAPHATAAAAIGLPDREPARLVEPAHTAGSYLLDEMGYRVARRHARKLRRIALAAGLGVAWLLLLLAAAAPAGEIGIGAAVLAVPALALGLAIERWLFFAEARHTVALYYGAGSL